MLFGPFSEAHQTENWTVELPEDDPEALRIIFHVVHGNFGNLPREWTMSKLYDIIVMADKYSMVGSLQPWGFSWTLSATKNGLWQPQDTEVTETRDRDIQKLLVLYHLGAFHEFERLFISLILKSKVNQDGQLLFLLTPSNERPIFGKHYRDWNAVGPLPGTVVGELLTISVEPRQRMMYIKILLSQTSLASADTSLSRAYLET